MTDGSITTIHRDDQNRPTKIDIADLTGKLNKTASVSYTGDGQHFHITNAETGALIIRSDKVVFGGQYCQQSQLVLSQFLVRIFL